MKKVVLAVVMLALLGGLIAALRPVDSSSAMVDTAVFRIAVAVAQVAPGPSATLVITPPSRQRDLIEITPSRDYSPINLPLLLAGVAFGGYQLSCTEALLDRHPGVLGRCERVECSAVAIEYPQLIADTAYEYLGRRTFTLPNAVRPIPKYRGTQLGGIVRIEVAYFLDDQCSLPQTFATTLDLRS
jgi:hypothetical protein